MKKILFLLILIVISIMIFSEPYRPYPIIYIHGYAADHYNAGNFGTVINSSTSKKDIINPTAVSPTEEIINKITDNYYISRNECKRIEEDKLAYRCFEYNKDVLNYWHGLANSIGRDTIFWIKNDSFRFNYIPNFTDIDLEDSLVINAFVETMEFDFPPSGSSDSTMKKTEYKSGEESKYPDEYQIGRGTQLKCKLKETLINYYTEGVADYQTFERDGNTYAHDVFIKLPEENARALDSNDLRGDSKVIFIAHSYGGVNLRQMLVEIYNQGIYDTENDPDDEVHDYTWLYNHIDKIITVDTPHLGTPPANHNDLLLLDASYYEYFSLIEFMNGIDWINTALESLPSSVLVLFKIFNPTVKEITWACPIWSYVPIIGFVQAAVKATQDYTLIFEDACYDLEPYTQEDQDRYSSIKNLLTTENLEIQNEVDYNVYATRSFLNTPLMVGGLAVFTISQSLNAAIAYLGDYRQHTLDTKGLFLRCRFV